MLPVRLVIPFLALLACSPAAEPDVAPPSPSPSPSPGAPKPERVAPPERQTPKVPAPAPSARLDDEKNTIDVFQAAAPGTVFVTQKRVMRDVWSMRALEVPAGSGTGFVWDTEGHVITNFHVIADGRSFDVALFGGKNYPARLVGGDPQKDIAVLKVDAPVGELHPIRLPPAADKLIVGQKALAIGNPFGLDHTLTVGVVSALGREVKGYGGVTIRDMIQTDAPINPGNSGGPLLDSAGQLIGMNTMIYSASGSSAGIGFAVPIHTIRRTVPQIIRWGRPQRASLGVELVPDEIASRNGIKGCVIAHIIPGGPAFRARLEGLKYTRSGTYVGDVIVQVGAHAVEDYDDFFNAMDQHEPGERVKVKVLRRGKVVVVDVTLALDR